MHHLVFFFCWQTDLKKDKQEKKRDKVRIVFYGNPQSKKKKKKELDSLSFVNKTQ
jgi:hypothetical protein